MKSRFLLLPLLVLCLLGAANAAKLDEEIEKVRREIEALEEMKIRKLDNLERTEAARWNARYRHNEEMKLLQSRSRQLESRYGVVANELNRKQEDILLLKNALDDQRENLDDTEAAFEGFTIQVRQVIQEAAEKLDSDFPRRIAERTALYSSLEEQGRNDNPPLGAMLRRFMEDREYRIGIADDQKLFTRAVLFNDGTERTVWTLRLGTVFMVDVDKNSDAIQGLLRTGALQGARYEWRSGLGDDFREKVMRLINAAREGKAAPVPLEVLQNGKVGTARTDEEQVDLWSRFQGWFQKGGIIMYPLLFCALVALILSLERFLTLTWRHHRYLRSYRRIMPLLNEGNWEKAAQYCASTCTGLTRAIHEIVKRRTGSREAAEQHVRQILLSEVPSLEKRLSIISTLGATAPLLGLLGTVSGMITLFRVITETGTNDARILAGGISEALVTTQTGLLVAIPILLIHGYLTERLDDVLSHYNETVLEVFNIVFNKGESGG